jgi:hypothetical protein
MYCGCVPCCMLRKRMARNAHHDCEKHCPLRSTITTPQHLCEAYHAEQKHMPFYMLCGCMSEVQSFLFSFYGPAT